MVIYNNHDDDDVDDNDDDSNDDDDGDDSYEGQSCSYWTKPHQRWTARAKDLFKMLLMLQCRFFLVMLMTLVILILMVNRIMAMVINLINNGQR